MNTEFSIGQDTQQAAAGEKNGGEERRRHQDFFEFSSDGYLVTDMTGTIQDANHATTAVLNMGRDFLLGKPLIGFVAEADRKTFFAQLAHLAKKQSAQEWEVRLHPRGGTPFPVAITGEAVRDAAGTVLSLRWRLRDITERWLAQEALRESDDLLSKLIQNSHDAIFIIEPVQGKILSVNPQACRMLGYPSLQLSARLFSDICQNEIADLLKYTEPGSQQEGEWKGVLTFVTQSLQVLPLEATVTSVDVAERPCVLVISRDGAGYAQTDVPVEDKVLRGLLPICAACKQIRDGAGIWHPLESYITAHSEAEFTHGLCPECVREFITRGTVHTNKRWEEGQ